MDRQPVAGRVAEIERELTKIWETALGVGPIGCDDDFHALGANSLLAAELLIRVEERFGRGLGFSTFFTGSSTVAGMARALLSADQEAGGSPAPTLVTLQPGGRRNPICWLPGGSGMSAIPYRTLSLLLGPDRPVHALEAPVIRGGPVDVRVRASAYVAALRAALPPPYTLLGYSSGAWMALEMARQLSAAGVEVRRVVVFDAPVPRTLSLQDRLVKAVQHLVWHVGRACTEPWKELTRLGTGMRRRTRGWISGPEPEGSSFPPGSLYDQVDRAVRAGLLAYSREPQEPWPGRIALVFGEQVDYPHLSGDRDLRFGWRRIAGGGLDVIRVPSDHLSMLEGREAKDLAARLRRLLDEDEAKAAPDVVQDLVVV